MTKFSNKSEKGRLTTIYKNGQPPKKWMKNKPEVTSRFIDWISRRTWIGRQMKKNTARYFCQCEMRAFKEEELWEQEKGEKVDRNLKSEIRNDISVFCEAHHLWRWNQKKLSALVANFCDLED